MIVFNHTNIDFNYAKNGEFYNIPANGFADIDEALGITAEDIIACYGTRVSIKESLESETEETPVNHEWQAKEAKAKAYFEDLEQCNDSDKYKKLEIMKELMDEASKEGRCYDNVSLMEDIEEAFAKLPKELVNGEEDETKDDNGTTLEGENNTKDNTSEGSIKDEEDIPTVKDIVKDVVDAADKAVKEVKTQAKKGRPAKSTTNKKN